MNEAHLRKIFGWTRNSDMPSIYVHLSGRDTDTAILKLYGIETENGNSFRGNGSIECSCGESNPKDTNFCSRCGEKLTTSKGSRERVQATHWMRKISRSLRAYLSLGKNSIIPGQFVNRLKFKF